jgi:hypothetical protein
MPMDLRLLAPQFPLINLLAHQICLFCIHALLKSYSAQVTWM